MQVLVDMLLVRDLEETTKKGAAKTPGVWSFDYTRDFSAAKPSKLRDAIASALESDDPSDSQVHLVVQALDRGGMLRGRVREGRAGRRGRQTRHVDVVLDRIGHTEQRESLQRRRSVTRQPSVALGGTGQQRRFIHARDPHRIVVGRIQAPQHLARAVTGRDATIDVCLVQARDRQSQRRKGRKPGLGWIHASCIQD